VIVSLIASGTFVTAAFLWWETRVPEPLLPLRLFRNGIYSVASVLGFLIGVALFGGVVFLPLFLQVVNGVSATDSGLLVLPLTAGIVVGSVGAGRLTTSTGRYRRYPIIGSALAVVGMYFLSGMTAETARVLSSSYMLVLGLGVGMVLQVTLLAVQNAVSHADLGVATSSAQFFRTLGGSFGVAIFGSIMNARLLEELPRRIPADVVDSLRGQVTELLSTPAAIRALPRDVATAVTSSVEVALQDVFFWAVPVMVLSFLLSWRLKEIPLRDTVGDVPAIEGVEEAKTRI